jgi:hypothetical protein
MYATPNIMDILEIKTNPLEHSCFGSATRADHSKITSRMIANIVKNRLRDNLEMTGKIFMTCGYDAEQQLLPLVFAVVAGEESVANWGWFMQWLRKEVVGPGKINVISDQHLGIRAVFERPDFG